MKRFIALSICALVLFTFATKAGSQGGDGPLTDAELEALRSTAPIPPERIRVFERILDDRAKIIQDLLRKPRQVSFASDMHDAIDQLGQIADEFSDNLDDFNEHHRDVRKVLPKLAQDTERWLLVLHSLPDSDRYDVVRKIAITSVTDLRSLTKDLQLKQDAYFKDHPDISQREKDKRSSPQSLIANNLLQH
jgi:hypothetical protein